MIRMLPLELEQQMFCLYEDTRLLAKCLYSSASGEIYGIVDVDAASAKPWHAGLLKATMSSMEYAGITTAFCRNKELFPLLKVLRFQPEGDDRMSVSLVGYFDTACECGDRK